MTAETDSHPPTEPFAAHEPARRGGSIVLVLLVAAGIVAVAVALMTIGRAQAQPYILGVLALLAMVGLFNLFAFAAGIIRFTDRAADDPVMGRIADHAHDGLGGDRPEGPCRLFERRLSGADGRREPRRTCARSNASSSAIPDVSEAVFRLLKAAREGKRQQEEVRIAGLRRRAGPLVADAGSSARPEQARSEIRGVVDRRHHAGPRAPGGRVPGAAARDRISRPRAMRLLLGQSGRRRHLCQRHAGELARLRPCRDRFGRAEAHRHRLRRRRGAVDLDRGGAGRGQDRSVRHRPAHARRQDHAGAALSQARLRRRRLAGFVAHARDQPRPRRAFRSRARRRSPLHAVLRPYADGDRDGGPRRRRRPRQRPLRQAGAEPAARTARRTSRSSAP